jgi:hypothetical protein
MPHPAAPAAVTSLSPPLDDPPTPPRPKRGVPRVNAPPPWHPAFPPRAECKYPGTKRGMLVHSLSTGALWPSHWQHWHAQVPLSGIQNRTSGAVSRRHHPPSTHPPPGRGQERKLLLFLSPIWWAWLLGFTKMFINFLYQPI